MEFILFTQLTHICCHIIGRNLSFKYKNQKNRNHFPAKNEEMVRLRLKDALASTVYEESFGNQFSEFGWTPHAFHYNRMRCMTGYANPDDPRTINMGTFNSIIYKL